MKLRTSMTVRYCETGTHRHYPKDTKLTLGDKEESKERYKLYPRVCEDIESGVLIPVVMPDGNKALVERRMVDFGD